MSEIKVTSFPEGNHEVYVDFSGQRVVLARVRATGLLQGGDLTEHAFAAEWVPDLIDAWALAYRIATREKPWAAWCGVSAGGIPETAGDL